ncbi:MAG: GGDEF domain-containing protein [Rhodobacteraceae bacterium]|nr:GGDEF domain-containing protein [Paracoccaceae bacterium]
MSGAFLDDATMNLLCPMHLRVGLDGSLRHCGPTFRHIRPDLDLSQINFMDLFDMVLPRGVQSVADLAAKAPTRIKLRFLTPPRTTLKGMVLPVEGADEVLINLSFGISVVDAVNDYALTGADFAHTDLAVELLYLVEAKSAAMDASRKLNQRLQGARMVAEERAFTDALTDLKNRRALDHVLARLCGTEAQFALMHLDLDKFKAVNDTLGHAVGDMVLKNVSSIMLEETRADDTVARVGGDEFVLIFPGFLDEPTIQSLAERLIRRIEIPLMVEDQPVAVSASAGTVLTHKMLTWDPAVLLDAADQALYAAKRGGRAQHRFYDSADA